MNKIEIKPIGFNVLLEMTRPKKETEGGIIIPEDKLHTQKYYVRVGKVIEVGSEAFTNITGEKFIEDKPKIGEYVLIESNAGQDVHCEDNKMYRIVMSDEIRAIIGEDSLELFQEFK